MKQLRCYRLAGLLVMLSLCLGLVATATGAPTLAHHDGDRLMTDAHLVMNGEVTGDLVAIGQYLSVPGRVGGDLLSAATEIQVDGDIAGSLRSASTALALRGRIGRNVSSIAAKVHVSETAVVAGSAYLFADTVVVSGAIHGNLMVHTQRLELSGHVTGDVTLRGTDKAAMPTLLLAPGTVIDGTLRYPEGTVVLRAEPVAGDAGAVADAIVAAEEVLPVPVSSRESQMERLGLKWGLRLVLSTLLLYLVALGLLRLYPGFFAYPTTCLGTRPAAVFGGGLAFFGILVAGLILLLLVSLLAMLLFNPVVVVALGLLLSFVFVFSLFLSTLPVALWLGDALQHGRGSIPGALALGMGVLTAARLLLHILGSVSALAPFVAIVVALGSFLVWIAGSGALLQGVRYHHEKAAIGLHENR